MVFSERTLLGFELDKIEAATQRELVLAELSLIIRGMPPVNAPMGTKATATGRGGRSPAKPASPGGM